MELSTHGVGEEEGVGGFGDVEEEKDEEWVDGGDKEVSLDLWV